MKQLLFGIITVFFIGCNVNKVDAPKGELFGSLTFPDGSRLTDTFFSVHAVPKNTNEMIIPTVNSMGDYHFHNLEPGEYYVWALATSNRFEFSRGYSHIVEVTDQPVRQDFYFGHRLIWDSMILETAATVSQDHFEHGGLSRGTISFYRYDLQQIGVGNRFDLIERIAPLSSNFTDDGGLEIVFRIYQIPENMKWSNNNPGELTFEFFEEQLTPAQELVFVLEPDDVTPPRGGRTYTDWEGVSFDIEAFFGAPNGVAFMQVGTRVVDAFNPYQLILSYTLEDKH